MVPLIGSKTVTVIAGCCHRHGIESPPNASERGCFRAMFGCGEPSVKLTGPVPDSYSSRAFGPVAEDGAAFIDEVEVSTDAVSR